MPIGLVSPLLPSYAYVHHNSVFISYSQGGDQKYSQAKMI